MTPPHPRRTMFASDTLWFAVIPRPSPAPTHPHSASAFRTVFTPGPRRVPANTRNPPTNVLPSIATGRVLQEASSGRYDVARVDGDRAATHLRGSEVVNVASTRTRCRRGSRKYRLPMERRRVRGLGDGGNETRAGALTSHHDIVLRRPQPVRITQNTIRESHLGIDFERVLRFPEGTAFAGAGFDFKQTATRFRFPPFADRKPTLRERIAEDYSRYRRSSWDRAIRA